jgi:hypothetical protein
MPDVVLPEVSEVLYGGRPWAFHAAPWETFLAALPDQCVDLVFCSPPYEQARLYLEGGVDLGVARGTEAWVAWLVEFFRAATRVCRGLVAAVVEGQTKGYRWTAGPALLMADLHRTGFNLRKPPAYHRVGIPGSGGPDWFRNDYEFCVCVTPRGRLPWSDPTACGHPPRWAPGGAMSHRLADGARVNQWGMGVAADGGLTATSKGADGGGSKDRQQRLPRKPSHVVLTKGRTNRMPDGTMRDQSYAPPVLANPGNVVRCKAGGGRMGSPLAHENEAPYPEALAERFVLSFCPPGGIVLDPFLGSGTTCAVAHRHGRRALGCDLRPSQVALATRRMATVQPELFGGVP